MANRPQKVGNCTGRFLNHYMGPVLNVLLPKGVSGVIWAPTFSSL